MVNCKNCGAPLSLDNPVCPNCQTANPEAQEHLRKLAQLNQDYHETKYEIFREVKKSKKGYGVLTIMIIVLLANLILIPFHKNTYYIAQKIVASKMPVEEVKKQFDIYLENRQYAEFVIFYDKYNANYKDYREYSQIYYLANDMIRAKDYITNYFFAKDWYGDLLISGCKNVKDFKDQYYYYVNNKFNEYDLTHLHSINEEFDLFLKTFLLLSDEEIATINNISESELVVLVSGRLADEQ